MGKQMAKFNGQRTTRPNFLTDQVEDGHQFATNRYLPCYSEMTEDLKQIDRKEIAVFRKE
jgi:hypothetical protein